MVKARDGLALNDIALQSKKRKVTAKDGVWFEGIKLNAMVLQQVHPQGWLSGYLAMATTHGLRREYGKGIRTACGRYTSAPESKSKIISVQFTICWKE